MSENNKVKAIYELDASRFNSGLKGINQNLRQSEASLKLANAGVKAFGSTTDNLKTQQKALMDVMQQQKSKVDLYSQALQKSKSVMDSNVASRDKLKAKLEQEKSAIEKLISTSSKEVQQYAKNDAQLSKLNSQLEKAKLKYGENSTEVKKLQDTILKLNNEQTKLVSTNEKEIAEYNRLKTSLDSTEKAYSNKTKQIDSNSASIVKNNTNLKKAQGELLQTQGKIKSLDDTLGKNKWKKFSEDVKKASEEAKMSGDKISGLGDKILRLSAPLVAVGGFATKFFMDYQSGLAQISTISDDTVVPIDKLGEQIVAMSNNSGIAVNALEQDVYDALSAGQQTGDVIDFVNKNNRLAKAGFAESGQSLDLLTTIMNSYGMGAKDVDKISNDLITTQNLGKVTVRELSESMGKSIPTAKSVGVNLDNLSTAYALMTSKGIKTAESTTYISSMLNELGKKGTNASNELKKATGKTFQELTASGMSLGDILAKMSEYAKKNGKSLSDMFGSAEAGKAGMILASGAGEEFNGMLKEMQDNAGETDKAFDKVANTSKERLLKAWNELKNNGIKLGQALIPLVEKGSEFVGHLAEKLDGLTQEQIETYAKVGLGIVAFGGLLKVLGGAVTAFGTVKAICGGVGGVMGSLGIGTTGVATATAGATASTGLLGGALAGLGITATGAIATVGALAGAVYLIKKGTDEANSAGMRSTEELGIFNTGLGLMQGQVLMSADSMDKLGIKYKDFQVNNEESKKSLEACRNKVGDLKFSLEELTLDNTLNEDEQNQFKGKVKGLVDDTINIIKKSKEESTKALEEVFKANDGKIDENEQNILDSINKSKNEQIDLAIQKEKEIYDLTAKWEKATGDEKIRIKEEINKKEDEVADIQFNNTKMTEEERLKNESIFNEQIKQLDIKQVAERLTIKKEEVEKEKTAIKEKYDNAIGALKANMATMNDEQKKNAQTQLENLEQQKKDALTKEDEKYQGLLKVAQKGHENLDMEFNLATGKEFTQKEKANHMEMLQLGTHMDKLNGITKTGLYKIYDETTKSWHDCYVEVDSTTGQMQSVYDTTVGNIYGNPVKAKEEIDDYVKKGVYEDINSNYRKEKDDMAQNEIEVYAKEKTGMFDWIKTAFNSVKRDIESQTISARVSSFGSNLNFLGNMFGTNKWTGDSNFIGGLTHLHERGEEIYDLPRGTRIYNAQRSEEMAMETAKIVAESVLKNNNSNGGGSNYYVTNNIQSLDNSPSELARIQKNSLVQLGLGL